MAILMAQYICIATCLDMKENVHYYLINKKLRLVVSVQLHTAVLDKADCLTNTGEVLVDIKDLPSI